jgi:hypothetical protein
MMQRIRLGRNDCMSGPYARPCRGSADAQLIPRRLAILRRLARNRELAHARFERTDAAGRGALTRMLVARSTVALPKLP